MLTIANKPTLRESLAFTIEGTSIKVTIPRNVASREAGNAIIDRLIDHVRARLAEVNGVVDWHISRHAGDGKACRGTLAIGVKCRIEPPGVTSDDIRRALHAAAAGVLAEVRS